MKQLICAEGFNFAFQSHIQVYEKAGVFSLPVLDKVKILLTPDASDLFSQRGIAQAKAIGEDHIDFYLKNRLFFVGQIIETGANAPEIGARMVDYAIKNGMDVKQVFTLVDEWLPK